MSFFTLGQAYTQLRGVTPWLQELPFAPVRYTLKYQADAWQRFFRGQGGRPRFKARRGDDRVTFPGGSFRIEGDVVRLARMIHVPRWQIAVAVIAVVFAVVYSAPNFLPSSVSWLPGDPVRLGLDLQGGSHLLLRVDSDVVLEERLESVLDEIRTRYRGCWYRVHGHRCQAADRRTDADGSGAGGTGAGAGRGGRRNA